MMSTLKCRPQERLAALAGMSVFLKGQSRRVARFGDAIRGATEMDSCGARITLCPSPPHPPTMETPPEWGQTGRAGSRAIGFTYRGGRGVCRKPVDCTYQLPANPHGSKQKCSTGYLEIPRVCLFYPRVGLFYPRFCFCVFPSPPLSISLFSLRKESEREGEVKKLAIHGFFECLKKHPRVWSAIHGFSGDEKTGKTQCWRGFAGVFPLIHASTGRNAYTSLELIRNEF